MSSYWEFYDFVENLKLEGMLNDKACKGCEADECDDCEGHKVLNKVANQIYGEALELMKSLAKEWVKVSVS